MITGKNKKGMIIVNVIDKITAKQINPNIPEFRVGDTVKVNVKIVEGNKERVQAYEGVVIARKGGGISETFTVRKESYGVGVERTFPINSPKIDSVVVLRHGKVRRAKLNFLKNVVGQYRIKERGQK
jgi:large subunit ribosomal protein L19